MPVYLVTVPTTPPTERLVDAPNQASARSLVARSMFKVEVAKGTDLFRLAKSGVELETTSPEPAAPEPPQQQQLEVDAPPVKQPLAEGATDKGGKAK